MENQDAFAVLSFVCCFPLDNRSPGVQPSDMPRRLRVEFEGAIYHVMARGNARRRIVRDDGEKGEKGHASDSHRIAMDRFAARTGRAGNGVSTSPRRRRGTWSVAPSSWRGKNSAIMLRPMMGGVSLAGLNGLRKRT
jgi:hypothetical protein